MPKSNGSSAAYASIAIAVFAAFLIWFGLKSWAIFSDYQNYHIEQREEAAKDNNADARKAKSPCWAAKSEKTILSGLECLAEKIASQPESKSAQYDLEAQQDMAESALAIVGLTILGLLVTTGGTIAILFTLRETRRANEITRDIGEAQVRAYLDIEFTKFGFFESRYLNLDIKVHNRGQSPCLKAEIKIFVTWLPPRGEDRKIMPGQEVKILHTLPAAGVVDLSNIRWVRIKKQDGEIRSAVVEIGVFGRDVFKKSVDTIMAYQILFSERDLAPQRPLPMGKTVYDEERAKRLAAIEWDHSAVWGNEYDSGDPPEILINVPAYHPEESQSDE